MYKSQHPVQLPVNNPVSCTMYMCTKETPLPDKADPRTHCTADTDGKLLLNCNKTCERIQEKKHTLRAINHFEFLFLVFVYSLVMTMNSIY
jgi:hypothetical protein